MNLFRFSNRRWSLRLLAALLLAVAPAAYPCTCVPSDLKEYKSRATVVFRGTVANVKTLLPARPESHRLRFAVTFRVSEYWTGAPSHEITLHILEGGTDCIGAQFDEGKEYVVYAHSQEAADYYLKKKFWFGWLDILPKGSSILTVNQACDPTDEVKRARKTLRKLGRGRKPAA